MLPWEILEIQGEVKDKTNLKRYVFIGTDTGKHIQDLFFPHVEIFLLVCKVVTSISDLYQDKPERGVKREIYPVSHLINPWV